MIRPSDAPALPSKGRLTFMVIVIAAVYAWSMSDTGANPITLILGIPDMANLFSRMWPPNPAYLVEMTGPLIETIQMALMGTFLGAVLSVPLVLLASKNISTVKPVFWAARSVLGIIRTVPDMLMASIFAGALGYGALPGVLALAVFSFGIISKLTSETVEAIDPGPMEALSAVGSPKVNVVYYGVVPQVLPQFVAYCLYVFEVNVRAATVLGLVGAGGIGIWLNRDMNLMMYKNAFSIILLVFAVVLIIDTISNWLRGRLV